MMDKEHFMYILENDTMVDELQHAIEKLNKLCKSTQIVREYNTNGEDISDKVYL